MNEDFVYNGFATKWIGFQYEFEEKLHTVISEPSFRNYIVTYPGSRDMAASQCQLMNEYIQQLEAKNSEYADYIDTLHHQQGLLGD